MLLSKTELLRSSCFRIFRSQPFTHVRKLQPVLALECPLADLVLFLMLFASQRHYGFIRCFQ